MSMDALTDKAFETLIKEILPRLSNELSKLQSISPEDRKPNDDLQFLFSESFELLKLMSSWVDGTSQAPTDNCPLEGNELDNEISDDDAIMMLDNLESGRPPKTTQNPEDNPNAEMSDEEAMAAMASIESDSSLDDSPRAVSNAEMSDEAAMEALASMDSDPVTADSSMEMSDEDAMSALTGMDENSNADADGEMSDAAAMAALEAMDDSTDGDGEMSDAAAMATLEAMDDSTGGDGEMSDAAAMAALEAMDDSTGGDDEMSDAAAMAALEAMDDSTGGAGEMSDAAAMAALAGMDDSAASETGMSDDAAMAALEAMDDSATEPDADAAALAMLESMGGAEVIENSQAQATPAVAEPKKHNEGELTLEEVGEIQEFGNSEFGSDPEMIKDFMENATELIDALDEQILNLESDPTNKETIEEIFRAAHTLKGAAGMFGYQAIERVMHRMENFFDQIRKGKLVATPDSIDVILRGIDILKILMEGIDQGSATGYKTAPIVLDLTLLGEGKFVKENSQTGQNDSQPDSATAATAATAVKPQGATEKGSSEAESSGSGDAPAPKQKKSEKKKEASTIRVDLERLDTLVNLVGELVTDRTRFMNIEDELRTQNPQLSATHNMSQTVQLFGRHMNEIQDTIMKVRMVPIGNAFNKFTRVIRDLSRQLGKEIDLVIEGEHTELDKTLVEQIGDPLVHLIRNSCDHGVEMPDKREANGKRRTGTILLSARQEGNQILISIQDDGNGIDADVIRRKGIEKGLISENDKLSDREIFGLIFESGFSTAEAVTNISGRGVGMDVVRKQIAKLKGMIDITSKLGSGTTITIQLPLTLAIVQSLVVKSRSEMFAIPLTSVVESLRISPDDIQKIGENEVIKRRDEILPLFYLEEILDLKTKDENLWYEVKKEPEIEAKRKARKMGERLFVVVVGAAERRFGVVVDNLLNQQEMVIKPMGKLMKDIPCIAGGAILGNGEVVLVLDTGQMDEMFRSKSRTIQAA